MYNRAGRALFIVGRQLTKKLCESTVKNSSGAVFRASNTSSHGTMSNLALQRNYCDKSSDVTDKYVPKLLPADDEASMKLKDYLAQPENERMYKIMELEVEVLRQNSEKVPISLRPSQWWELIQLESRSKRKRYLAFLWGLERKKENQQVAKDDKRKLRNERPPCETSYKLGDNSMFLRIYDSTMNNMWNSRLINTMLHGQPIVLDCGYENHMTRMEMRNCARQLKLSFAENRVHDDPFNLYFCNTNNSGDLMKALHRFIPPLYDSDFPLNVRTESYLDVFDKNRLIYLTPHCQQEMTEFDHDAVYIIGAFVDKSSNEPVSLAKAKKEGLKMMKFPLDRYLQWGCSSGKNLTINAVVKILLDLRSTGSWVKALENVPRRKLYEFRQAASERQLRKVFDPETSSEETNEIVPLQVLKTKVGQRYNSHPESRVNSRTDYRSSYNRDSGPNNDRHSSDTMLDFSMEGRSKLKKNWKN